MNRNSEEGLPQMKKGNSFCIEDWKRRKALEEEKWMQDKPRTYEYTMPYQEHSPPRWNQCHNYKDSFMGDINKYFHDSKYDHKKPDLLPDDYYFEEDMRFGVNPIKPLTTYENTFYSPRRQVSRHPTGGLYIIRFHNSGYEEVNLALKNMQAIIRRSYDGYVMGIAMKTSIFVLEGDGGWEYSKKNQTNPRIGFPHRLTENAIAVLWFPDFDKAHKFFCSNFRNPFKEQGFPTSHGYESFYVPMLTPPVFKDLDTYLLLEFPNANKYTSEDLLGFEAETREAMYHIISSSNPMVVSCLQHRENNFKPGSFSKQNSKIFISRFASQTEVTAVWNSAECSWGTYRLASVVHHPDHHSFCLACERGCKTQDIGVAFLMKAKAVLFLQLDFLLKLQG